MKRNKIGIAIWVVIAGCTPGQGEPPVREAAADTGTVDASVAPQGPIPQLYMGPIPDDAGPEIVECEPIDLEPDPITPRVMLFIDRSYSMNDPFTGTDLSRWNAVKQFVLDSESGLIASFQAQIEFGVALYSSDVRNENTWDSVVSDECPHLVTVSPALGNYEKIVAAYDGTSMMWDTPTGPSIHAMLDQLVADQSLDGTPTKFIIATDGRPDSCEPGHYDDYSLGEVEALAAVERARSLGIETYMVWIGDLDSTLAADHMQEMANAGVGGDDAQFWVAGDDAGLRDALSGIVGSVMSSCDISLSATVVPESACELTVRLNGRALECNGQDGWALLPNGRIELRGGACTELQASPDATLETTVPCEVPTVPII